MKRFFAAALVTGACLAATAAAAHDPLAELKANVKASQDAVQSQIQGQSSDLDAAFEDIDELKVRIDVLAARAAAQSAAIDDLYRLVDEIKGSTDAPGEVPKPAKE